MLCPHFIVYGLSFLFLQVTTPSYKSEIEQWRPWLERAGVVLGEDLQLELAALAKRKSALSSGQLKRARALAKRHPAWSRRAAF